MNEDKTIGAEGCRFETSEKKKVVFFCNTCFREEQDFYTCGICGGELEKTDRLETKDKIKKTSSPGEVSTSSISSSSSSGGARMKLLHPRRRWANNTSNSSFRADTTEEEKEREEEEDEKDVEEEEEEEDNSEEEEEGKGEEEEKKEEEEPKKSPGQLRTIVIDGCNVAFLHGRQKTFSVQGLLSKLIISLSPFYFLHFTNLL